MFTKLLTKIKFNPTEDQLILLGDYCDRGEKSKDVIELVFLLVNKHGAIALRGNHEEMFLNFMEGIREENFLFNGGISTLRSYYDGAQVVGVINEIDAMRLNIEKNHSNHIDFIKNLPYYHEDEKHIFVHAGINPVYADWKNTPNTEMVWIRDVFIKFPLKIEKIVVFGHTPCLTIHGKKDAWFGGDKIGIDGGAGQGLQLNCLVINEDGYEVISVEKEELIHGVERIEDQGNHSNSKEDRIAAIKERLEKATPGPWGTIVLKEDEVYICKNFEELGKGKYQAEWIANMDIIDDENNKIEQRYDDAQLIANAPEDIHFLLEEVERMQVEIDRLKKEGHTGEFKNE